jgi:hypothetical protein
MRKEPISYLEDPWLKCGYRSAGYREVSGLATPRLHTRRFVLQCLLLTSANRAYPKSTFHWSKLMNTVFSVFIPDVAGL